MTSTITELAVEVFVGRLLLLVVGPRLMIYTKIDSDFADVVHWIVGYCFGYCWSPGYCWSFDV